MVTWAALGKIFLALLVLGAIGWGILWAFAKGMSDTH